MRRVAIAACQRMRQTASWNPLFDSHPLILLVDLARWWCLWWMFPWHDESLWARTGFIRSHTSVRAAQHVVECALGWFEKWCLHAIGEWMMTMEGGWWLRVWQGPLSYNQYMKSWDESGVLFCKLLPEDELELGLIPHFILKSWGMLRLDANFVLESCF